MQSDIQGKSLSQVKENTQKNPGKWEQKALEGLKIKLHISNCSSERLLAINYSLHCEAYYLIFRSLTSLLALLDSLKIFFFQRNIQFKKPYMTALKFSHTLHACLDSLKYLSLFGYLLFY